MYASAFLPQVEREVLLEVAVGAQGAQLENTFGALESPSGAGQVEPVLDEMPARPFDHPGCDGPALFERSPVVEVVPLGEQVVGAAIGVLPGGWIETEAGGLAPDRGGDCRGVPLEHTERLGGDPVLGCGAALGEERTRRRPQVHQDMNDVDDDVDLHLSSFRLSVDAVDLVRRAVDEDDPGAPMF